MHVACYIGNELRKEGGEGGGQVSGTWLFYISNLNVCQLLNRGSDVNYVYMARERFHFETAILAIAKRIAGSSAEFGGVAAW